MKLNLQVPSTSFINFATSFSRRSRPKWRGCSCIFLSSTMWKNISLDFLPPPPFVCKEKWFERVNAKSIWRRTKTPPPSEFEELGPAHETEPPCPFTLGFKIIKGLFRIPLWVAISISKLKLCFSKRNINLYSKNII